MFVIFYDKFDLDQPVVCEWYWMHLIILIWVSLGFFSIIIGTLQLYMYCVFVYIKLKIIKMVVK